MYLIVNHWDLSEVMGRWGIPQESGGFSCSTPNLSPLAGLWFSLPDPASSTGKKVLLDEEDYISAKYRQLI